MTKHLRALLTVLVFLCMGFVHITGVVDWVWLGPFYALTALAPWLAPHNQKRLPRFAWNGGVFFIFAILVNDATKSGVNHMLEDGLILAAFCQVHLLNNLGRKQSPDLLFFNSFLIVLVTCFFSDSLELILLFVPWAFLQIASMQLASLVRDGRDLPRSATRWVLLSSAKRAVVALTLCAVAFVVTPRDFGREGLAARFLSFGGGDTVGFSDEIRLGTNKLSNFERSVLRIKRRSPGAPWPEYWRGATMSRLLGQRWTASTRVRTRSIPGDTHFRPQRRIGSWSASPARVPTNEFEVEVLDVRARRIFLPSATARFRIDPSMEAERVNVRGDRSVTYERRSDRNDIFRYTLATGAEREPAGKKPARRRNDGLAAYAILYDDNMRAHGAALVQEATGGRRAGEAQRAFVERLRLALSQRQAYALPGEEGAAKSLQDFLSGAKGHCELFASALAIALRSEAIPCRLVSGFRIEPAPELDTQLVRSGQAHAWVEVWDPSGGWYTVDSTPAAERSRRTESDSWFATLQTSMRELWKGVVGLDAESRGRALAWLRDLPAALLRSPWTHPGRFAGSLALLACLVLLARRRRPRLPEAVVDYEDAVAATGLERERSETPQEFLRRAQGSEISAETVEKLAAATALHERRRYAAT